MMRKQAKKDNILEPPRQEDPHANRPILKLSDLPIKRQLLKRFYQSSDSNQRKTILLEWPSASETFHALLKEQGYIETKKDSYIVGTLINNMIHGYGLVLYSASRFYEGSFQNNFKHGGGLQCLPNGVYIGNYVNNKPEGRGCFYWNNGQSYEGQFVAGVKHGSGRWACSTQSYTGEWKANKPEGMGIIVTQQSRYEGEVRAGLKHGHGKEQFKNGDKYIGGYVNGRPQGQGEYIWSKNTSYFRGVFKNGLRHGHGTWVQGGDRYEGSYLNDKKNGRGTFQWASGNHFIGNYFDDLRHGYGQMHWADGSWYKGQWKYGVQHGVGEMCESGQNPRRGIFENNTLIKQEQITNAKPKLQHPNRKLAKTKEVTSVEKPSIQKSRQRDIFARKVPSFVTRPSRYGFLTKSTLNGDTSDKKSQLSYTDKEINSSSEARWRPNGFRDKARSSTHDKPKAVNSRSHRPVLNSHTPVADLSIIQWSNIKNIHMTTPLARSSYKT